MNKTQNDGFRQQSGQLTPYRNRPQGNYNSQQQRSAVKPQHSPKGHDALLKRYQDNEVPLVFKLVGESKLLHGIIKGRDKFTISIAPPDSEFGCMTIYKSAIAFFAPNDFAQRNNL